MASATTMTGEYAGWIPCVSGQLSFSLVEVRERGVSLNLAISDVLPSNPPVQRVFAAAAEWLARDVPALFFLRSFRRSSRMRLVVIAETTAARVPIIDPASVSDVMDPVGLMKGTVWVLPHPYAADLRRRSNRMFSNARKFIAALRRKSPGVSEASTVRRALAEVENEVIPNIAAALAIPVDFEMHRSGEIRISLGNGPASTLDNSHQHWLCAQIFFFLKHAAHRHYHHHRDADSLIPLTKLQTGDDETWRRETLWAMTRAVLSARKRGAFDGYRNGIGILAYAQAFQNGLASIVRSGTGFVKLTTMPRYNFDEMRTSIEVKRDEAAWSKETGRFQLNLGVTIALAITAIWFSAFSIRDSIRDTLCRDAAAAPIAATLPSKDDASSSQTVLPSVPELAQASAPSIEINLQNEREQAAAATDQAQFQQEPMPANPPAADSALEDGGGTAPNTAPKLGQIPPFGEPLISNNGKTSQVEPTLAAKGTPPIEPQSQTKPAAKDCTVQMPQRLAAPIASFMRHPDQWLIFFVLGYFGTFLLYKGGFQSIWGLRAMQRVLGRFAISLDAQIARALTRIAPSNFDRLAVSVTTAFLLALAIYLINVAIQSWYATFMSGL